MMEGVDLIDNLVFWGPRSFKLQSRMHNSRKFFWNIINYIFFYLYLCVFILQSVETSFEIYSLDGFAHILVTSGLFIYFFVEK
jgi:hypothetical protein